MVEFPARTTFDSWRVTNQILATKTQQKWWMPKILGKTHQVLTKSHGHRPISAISSSPRGSFSHPPDAVRGTPACCYTSWRVATGGKAMGSVCHGGCRGDSPIVMVITRQHGWTWPVVFDDPGWFTYCKWWANYDITRWYTPHTPLLWQCKFGRTFETMGFPVSEKLEGLHGMRNPRSLSGRGQTGHFYIRSWGIIWVPDSFLFQDWWNFPYIYIYLFISLYLYLYLCLYYAYIYICVCVCVKYVYIYIYIVRHNYSIYIPQSLSELIREKIVPKGMVKLALSFAGHSRGASLQIPVSWW